MFADTDILDRRYLRIDRVMMILQLATYVAWVGLLFVTTDNLLAVYISRLAVITCSLLIKLYRQCARQISWRQLIIDTQLGFYVIYLLTAFQLVFEYKSLQYITSTHVLVINFSAIIILTINYSLFTNSKSLTAIQVFVYSIGIGVYLSLNINLVLKTIEVLFGVEGGAYLQSYILLTVSTRITIGAKIISKIYDSYKAHNKALYEAKQQKKSIEIELAETLNSRKRSFYIN